MDAAQDIIERAKGLPPTDRRRIIDALGHDLSGEAEEPESSETETVEHRERRRAALKRFLARAGTVHSDFTDISGNTDKHLAEIYADNHHLPSDKK